MPQQNATSLTPTPTKTPWWAVAAVIAVGAGLLTLTACSTTPGSGRLKTEARDVSGFSTVELNGSGDLTIRQTDTESLTIRAEANVLPTLTSKVSRGTLRLGAKSGTNVTSTLPIHYRLTVRNLAGVRVSGSGSIAASQIDTPQLDARISGSGNISIVGSTVDETVSLSGSGNYTASALASKTVVADISGSGNASVQVRDTLSANITGSGNVTYSGGPRLHQQIAGSGRLIKK